MYDEVIADLAKELNVSELCAGDVFYLRSRSRWSQELEDELIERHQNGERPNMNDFGVTRETQRNLANTISASKHTDSESQS